MAIMKTKRLATDDLAATPKIDGEQVFDTEKKRLYYTDGSKRIIPNMDDTAIDNESTWSSKQLADVFGTAKTQTGATVTLENCISGYPIKASSAVEGTYAGTGHASTTNVRKITAFPALGIMHNGKPVNVTFDGFAVYKGVYDWAGLVHPDIVSVELNGTEDWQRSAGQLMLDGMPFTAKTPFEGFANYLYGTDNESTGEDSFCVKSGGTLKIGTAISEKYTVESWKALLASDHLIVCYAVEPDSYPQDADGVLTASTGTNTLETEDGIITAECQTTDAVTPPEVHIGTAPEKPTDGLKLNVDPDAQEISLPEVFGTTGQSTEDTMSQKAITDALEKKLTYEAQTLTEAEQEQARKNIGANNGEWELIVDTVLEKTAPISQPLGDVRKVRVELYLAGRNPTDAAAAVQTDKGAYLDVWGSSRGNYMYAEAYNQNGFCEVRFGWGDEYVYSQFIGGAKAMNKYQGRFSKFVTWGDVVQGATFKVWVVK